MKKTKTRSPLPAITHELTMFIAPARLVAETDQLAETRERLRNVGVKLTLVGLGCEPDKAS